MTRIRMSLFWRCRDAKDSIEIFVSWDKGAN